MTTQPSEESMREAKKIVNQAWKTWARGKSSIAFVDFAAPFALAFDRIRKEAEDRKDAEYAKLEGPVSTKQSVAPMGVSAWMEHGKKYGYDEYLIGMARKEGAEAVVKAVEIAKVLETDNFNDFIEGCGDCKNSGCGECREISKKICLNVAREAHEKI